MLTWTRWDKAQGNFYIIGCQVWIAVAAAEGAVLDEFFNCKSAEVIDPERCIIEAPQQLELASKGEIEG